MCDVLIQLLPLFAEKKLYEWKILWLINPAKEIKGGLDQFWV